MHLTAPPLADGEIHVATIQIAGQAPYHLILLPDHPEDEMTHQAATEWASSIGGELPNRAEHALLFAHNRGQLYRDWYWSNTLHESAPDYAWCQDFGYGNQLTGSRYGKLRARAVRRLPL